MDVNSTHRCQPLNNHQTAGQIAYHSNGILAGVRPTPPQFFSAQVQPNMSDNVNARHQFFRAMKTTNDVGNNVKKNMNPKDSSLFLLEKKRNAIGKSSYYSNTGEFSTKNHDANVSRDAVRRARSSGTTAIAKKRL